MRWKEVRFEQQRWFHPFVRCVISLKHVKRAESIAYSLMLSALVEKGHNLL